MTLIIRAITKKRILYLADGRISNTSGIISDSVNKIINKNNEVIIALSGILDDSKGNNRFNIITALDTIKLNKCTNIILTRQKIIDKIIEEYSKEASKEMHQCLLLYSAKCKSEIVNGSIKLIKDKCFGVYKVKNSFTPFENIIYAINKSNVSFNGCYIKKIRSNQQLDITIDFNHLYNEGINSMPFFIKQIIPHLFLQSVFINTGELSITELPENTIAKIGKLFFEEFNKYFEDPKIGNYQMHKVLDK